MKNVIRLLSTFMMVLLLNNAFAKHEIKTEEIAYKTTDGTLCKGYVAYPADQSKSDVILVVHEWWGCNDYARMRANMLAELGYFAFAVDMYGDGKIGADPKAAGELAGAFYNNPKLVLDRLQGAESKLKDFPMANTDQMGAIGYCFGGSMVLNAIKLGMDFKGVVSFHGNLQGVPVPAEGIKGKILVCHGNADAFVKEEEVKNFKADMDKNKIDYKFIGYDNATHAFTNPAATETGKKFSLPIEYNKAADLKSWNDMQEFLKSVLK